MAPVSRHGLWVLLALLSGSAIASPVWYTDGARLGHVDLTNGMVSHGERIGNIRRVAATAEEGVWVLTDQDLLSISSSGAVRFRASLATLAYEPSSASLDKYVSRSEFQRLRYSTGILAKRRNGYS